MEFHLRHAFKSYRNAEQQNQAIDELERWLKDNQPEQLENFYRAWWQSPTPPTESNAKPQRGTFSVPGWAENVSLSNPIFPGSSFTWAEATASGNRLPHNKDEALAAIALAEQLQAAQNKLGKQFHIASWYHKQHVGAPGKHPGIIGDSVDLWVEGYSGKQLAEMFDWWPGGLGVYSYVPYMINLDIGDRRRWHAGYPLL